METLVSLGNSIQKHLKREAFCINEKFYSYLDLAKSISKIRIAIQNRTSESDKNIGIVANDDLDTYAAIIAIWFEGKAYIPIGIDTPKSRNETILEQTEVITIIDTSEIALFPDKNIIVPAKLVETEIDLVPKMVSNEEISIILFTSGTTGIPKGAPLTRKGISVYMNAFWEIGFDIDENDRCLQMFEITFDFAVIAYLAPLLKGACVYTVPKDVIKFSYIHELLEDHKLTSIHLVPSILLYLRPYFDDINLPSLKTCLLSGEALQIDLVKEWSDCVPNAKIFNSYGATEDTVFCTSYIFNKLGNNKSYNGTVSVGKAMKDSYLIIVDENNNIVPIGEKGELCLGGPQLTPGYWKNEDKNKQAFFNTNYKGELRRFYKTGDLCLIDDEGDIMYLGRIDFQAKIQGFRVELSEVEYHAQISLGKINVVAIAYQTKIGSTELGLVIESEKINTKELIEQMKMKLDAYMIPSKIEFVEKFPLNMNGKIDRKELKKMFN